MKLRLYFRPSPVALLLAAAAALLWFAVSESPAGRWLLPVAVFYSGLAALSVWALLRLFFLERWCTWSTPQRLLILAPHEDDCVISAGGIALHNRKLGGVVRIAYLAPDQKPGLPEIRAAEARAAWKTAGFSDADLTHVDLLPSTDEPASKKLHAAGPALRRIIDDFQPNTIVVPMFEGGHVQHDMLAALLATVVGPADRFDVYEAPEYSPYVSLNNTPHRILALCARWLFGLLSYYGPPDGIDGRVVHKFRMSAEDIETKRQMLACFVSQNAPSLVATRSYPDRLVRMNFKRSWTQPFAFAHSYLRLALAAHRLLPQRIARGLLPGATGTIGRDGELTDWRREFSVEE